MPLDDFMVAWDNLALLMRQRKNNTSPLGRTWCSAWLRPVGTDAPGVYHMYINGEEHLLADDFAPGAACWHTACPTPSPMPPPPTGSSPMWSRPKAASCWNAVTPPRKYTVYAIDSAGGMLVGDVTV